MAKNTNLHKAKSAKQDEFYTQLSDIEKEMIHYKDFFKGKIVYCNCDDARESNFFKYFSMNFEHLGLKKLISTGYKADGKGVVLVYEGDKNNNRRVDDNEIVVTELQGNGDFRSAECIEYLKQADVVVTNPPFSLFREYVAQLMEYGKKFIIIGPLTAVGYKDIFANIKENKMWLGMNKVTDFKNYYTNEIGKVGCRWFTNIINKKRTEPIDLYKKYNEKEYPKYANYNGIDCKSIAEIPIDYEGNIGVPLSILDNYCPTQFEILAVSDDTEGLKKIGVEKIGKEGIALKNKCGNKAHISENSYELYYVDNGLFKRTFRRIVVHKLNN